MIPIPTVVSVLLLGYNQSRVPLFNAPFVRAYGLRKGELLSERRFAESGTPHVVELHDDLLFTAGSRILLRALDTTTGSVRWKRDPGGDVHDVAVSEGRVFVSGLRTLAVPPRPDGYEPGTETDALVLAYDAQDGTPLWEDVFDSGELHFDGAYAVAVDGNRVFAVGGAYEADRRALLVRAYDARNGKLLWRDPSSKSAVAWAVAAEGRLVFVAGESDRDDRTTMPFLRAYDAGSEALEWETDLAPVLPVVATFVDVVARAGRVYAAGSDGSFLVLAVDRRTGSRIWLRRSEAPGQAASLTTAEGRIFASGWLYARTQPFRASGFTQAYDAETGRPLWSDRLDGEWSLTRANEAADGRLLVIGDTSGDFVLRAYGTQ